MKEFKKYAFKFIHMTTYCWLEKINMTVTFLG